MTGETKWTAETVKRLRQHLGLTQEEMAHELGTTAVSVSRWERGVKPPSRMAQQALSHLEAEGAKP